MTADLWSASQTCLEPGGDLGMNPGWICSHQDASQSGKEAAAAASLAGPVPADAGVVGSVAACY